jgi:hypothetical protein
METEEKYLVAQPQTTLQTVQVIQSLAPIVQASRMFGVTAEQAAVVMLKGHELGIGLATAFEFIHVIDGKPSISPKGMMALIHGSGQVDVRVTRLPEDKSKPLVGYECHMKRRDSGFEYTARFTLEDAKKAELIKPHGNWDKYPENMCMWRAIGFAADVVCPDLGGGMYRPEELGAVVDSDGEPVIEGTATPCPEPQTVTTTIPGANVSYTLQGLVAQHGAEAVMQANGGRIPANDTELAAIAEKLEATSGSHVV